MAESVETVKLSDELGPVDYLMHRGEANPRTRSGIMALELLDTTPDWERFRNRFENASRRVLRLRQKGWVPDPVRKRLPTGVAAAAEGCGADAADSGTALGGRSRFQSRLPCASGTCV